MLIARPTRVRHFVLWLTVLAYMITYMDRVVISTAAPSIQAEYGFDNVTMGWIFAAFQISYALFQIPGGWLGDRFGPRRALAVVVTWWSAFTALTTTAWSAGSMIAVRFLFGMGEAGAFPIATRSLSRWMLPSERGWAQGLTHAGARLGAALTPVLVAYLIASYGWRAPFLIFALLGLAWGGFWYFWYRDSPRDHGSVNEAELALIEEALGTRAARKSVPWGKLLGNRTIWLLSSMYFCYGYCIVTFLAWFPKYLSEARDFELTTMGLYASVPLAAGVLGDLAGGWLSDGWLKRTGNLKMARRGIAVAGFLIAGVMVPFAATAADPNVSVACFALAVFGLELTVGVSWAVTLDIGGEYAGSVSAVMNTFGNTAGAITSAATGYLVVHSGWISAFYVVSAFAFLGAVLFLWLDASRRLYVEPDSAA
jgi:sugar phosphate permease